MAWIVLACARRSLVCPVSVSKNLGRRPPSVNSPAGGRSEGLFEDRLVSVALRCRQMSDEIGVERLKGELATVIVLKFQFTVLDDAGAMQDAAGFLVAGANRTKSIGDGHGAVAGDAFDD